MGFPPSDIRRTRKMRMTPDQLRDFRERVMERIVAAKEEASDGDLVALALLSHIDSLEQEIANKPPTSQPAAQSGHGFCPHCTIFR